VTDGEHAQRRERAPPRWGERGFLRHRAAQALFGGRAEDEPVRQRWAQVGRRTAKSVTVVGLLSTGIGLLYVDLARPWIRQQLEAQRSDRAELAPAIVKLAKATEELAEANKMVVRLAVEKLEGPLPRREVENRLMRRRTPAGPPPAPTVEVPP
jgi:hypothetical protein